MKWCSVHMSVLHPPITQDHTQSVSQSAKKGVEASHEFAGLFVNRRPRLTIPSMFISSMWDVKEPTHYSKRVGREVSRCCGCPSGLVLHIGITSCTFPPWTEMSKKNGYVTSVKQLKHQPKIITFLPGVHVQSN